MQKFFFWCFCQLSIGNSFRCRRTENQIASGFYLDTWHEASVSSVKVCCWCGLHSYIGVCVHPVLCVYSWAHDCMHVSVSVCVFLVQTSVCVCVCGAHRSVGYHWRVAGPATFVAEAISFIKSHEDLHSLWKTRLLIMWTRLKFNVFQQHQNSVTFFKAISSDQEVKLRWALKVWNPIARQMCATFYNDFLFWPTWMNMFVNLLLYEMSGGCCQMESCNIRLWFSIFILFTDWEDSAACFPSSPEDENIKKDSNKSCARTR